MKKGYLSGYFTGVAAKRLSEVEANPGRSNQHEFNGIKELQDIFGTVESRRRFDAKFIYLTDQDDGIPVEDDGFLTWYDARERHPSRTEYRFYYSDNQALQCAATDDLVLVARCHNDLVLVIVAEHGTSIERQLLWLFGLEAPSQRGYVINREIEDIGHESDFAVRLVLEQIGIFPEVEESHLDGLLEKFQDGFPSTRDFSAHARSTLPHIASNDDPDAALMEWMEQEEILYRVFEKHLLFQSLQQLIEKGEQDPEPFIKIIQSTLQRRKSRAGHAMENHIEQIFFDHKICHTRGGITEGRSKPDFILPGIDCYHNPAFPSEKLFMLGVKTTCKDRWRQILSEAERIPVKYLATLEAAISSHQTNEMQRANVQLVIPRALHASYNQSQQSMLLTIRDFIGQMMLNQAQNFSHA